MPWNPEHYMKTKEVVKILEENKITNVGNNGPYSREEEAMEISRRQSKKNKEERMEPITIIHTETFYCDGSEDEYDQHPRVHYTFNNKVDSTDKTDKGYVVCEYCYRKFKYEDKDWVNNVLKGSG
jgi:uncharacterized Zn-finger protein